MLLSCSPGGVLESFLCPVGALSCPLLDVPEEHTKRTHVKCPLRRERSRGGSEEDGVIDFPVFRCARLDPRGEFRPLLIYYYAFQTAPNRNERTGRG